MNKYIESLKKEIAFLKKTKRDVVLLSYVLFGLNIMSAIYLLEIYVKYFKK